MPFGLKNAPATFQRLMQNILGELHLNGCVVYLDDIIIYSKTEEEHKDLLARVLQKLREAGLKLSPKKCSFLQQKVKCLGHIVSGEGISCDPKKISAVEKWPTPTCVKDIQKFIGFTGFYRRFIKGYAKIAKPLTDLLCGCNPRTRNRTVVILESSHMEVDRYDEQRKITRPTSWNSLRFIGLSPSSSTTTCMEHPHSR